jgi:hypothetical protein
MDSLQQVSNTLHEAMGMAMAYASAFEKKKRPDGTVHAGATYVRSTYGASSHSRPHQNQIQVCGQAPLAASVDSVDL